MRRRKSTIGVTKAKIKKELDKVFSELIRKEGYCVKCQRTVPDVTLHCAHIFSRKNMAVRWDMDNAIALCCGCHLYWAHKEPVLFTEFVKEYLGESRFEALKTRAKAIKKWTADEMLSYLGTLKKQITV